MSGYIGSKASVVTPGAERKKTFAITTTTTSLTGLSYTPGFVHVYHNGIRLVDGTDYTATNGTSITLTNAALSGDEVVVISYATFTPADAYTKAESDNRYVNVTGDTMTGGLNVTGGNVGIGTDAPDGNLVIHGSGFPELKLYNTSATANDSHIFVIRGYNNTSTLWNRLNYSASSHAFDVYGTERMRIDSNGWINVNYPEYTSTTSQFVIRKDNPTVYNNSHLELISTAGDVILGFHAGGATAICLDHVRGGGSIRCVAGNRSVFAPLEASAFTVGSDYRLKENIVPMVNAVDRLSKLKVHQFNFIEGSMSYNGGATVDGFLAHEVQEVVPEAITGTKDAVDENGNPQYQGIDQSKLVPLLTAALQEALTEIADLKARVAALEGN